MTYSNAERADFLREAHERVRQWRDEKLRRRDGITLVTKTNENARVPAHKPAKARADHDGSTVAVSEPPGWEFIRAMLVEAFGQQQQDFQAALAERDREMKSLRREIKLLRDEVGLERGLANLKTEVAEARQLQPNFEGKLNVLQGQIAKVQKTTSRLRAGQSTLEFKQQHLSELEFKQRRIVTDTAVKMTNIGAQTRAALEALRASGFEFWEMPSSSGLVS